MGDIPDHNAYDFLPLCFLLPECGPVVGKGLEESVAIGMEDLRENHAGVFWIGEIRP